MNKVQTVFVLFSIKFTMLKIKINLHYQIIKKEKRVGFRFKKNLYLEFSFVKFAVLTAVNVPS